MIVIEQNKSLLPYNTFGIDVQAKYFGNFSSVENLIEVLSFEKFEKEEKLILGGGSNILFTKNVNGLLLRNQIKGIEIIEEKSNSIVVAGGAGEVWHEFVLASIDMGLGGLENMSLIPGSLGASPMQNIGAYGAEVKDNFTFLEAYHIPTGEIHRFENAECEFGYRESVFKRKLKGEYVITKVAFELSKNPELNTTYGAIDKQLEGMGISNPTIKDVSNAVIAIRKSKLPDPKEIGNSGSFFKNPVIEKTAFLKIIDQHPNIPNYPAPNGVKVAAGWLIEQAGWKGKTIDNYGVHKNQALVLVNYGGATGKQIYDLSTEIIASVLEKFGITLEREVNIL